MPKPELIRRILEQLLSGSSPEDVSRALGISIRDIIALQEQAAELASQIPYMSTNKVRHQLTVEDRRKGWALGEAKRKVNREQAFDQVVSLIKASGAATRISSVAYFLSKGSRKEFSVTVSIPEVGKLFLQSLLKIGVQADCVKFEWRNCEPTSLTPGWRSINCPITFANVGAINSMRLTTKAFMTPGGIKLSSRALGRAFHLFGHSLVVKYANE